MKTYISSFIAVFVFFIVSNAQNEYAKNITIESVKAHIDTLASESMKGRNTGEDGQKIAARYISDIFNYSYLKSPYKSSYYQRFNLFQYKNGTSTIQTVSNPFFPTVYFGSEDIIDSISLKAVFAGFGTSMDFKNLDTRDKLITILADDVKSSIERIKQIAIPDRPNYFVVALPPGNTKFKEDEIKEFDSFMKLYFFEYIALGGGMMDSIGLSEFRNSYSIVKDLRISSTADIRVFFISQDWLIALFGKNANELKKISKENQTSTRNLLTEINGDEILLQIDFSPKLDTIGTENVIGYIEGNELKDEFVIVGAHYDHVGINHDSTINYGADDNASGTGAVLELAKQFAQAKKDGVKFKRSILFMTFSAEEKGLYGSKVFVNNPPFPLGKIHLLINMDMIGRNQDNKEEYNNTVYIAGWEGGSKFRKVAKKENKKNTNLKVDFTPGMYQRLVWRSSSDHHPFMEHEVPVLVFFTGLHPDYHTSLDTPDKINYDKYHRIVQLIFETTWEIVNK
ncbi:MAG: hypothetical protein A2X13_01985 [Bacteroidetes bacterium GWC2_33_15]|nr:MAG: hypothetical protein A2X10_07640 [Bacteroidetes bacterium GWA2_33_15]OFX52249.1 MAG: hypothetical protein A2X13_01985 [Bacteroidetes bacterium GWC2_33_15]OFX64403.1 MAG: hypothetical protein A2X15_12805 [Bacteroidetes bacterium GWB2_32_14]OFX67808.1 MAG: hypothetical protein A2X14_06630 [Bacteroidetes bacterium GWD2_33_33]HAN19421.1 hypothetical protein [Bacteroidales bacterium]